MRLRYGQPVDCRQDVEGCPTVPQSGRRVIGGRRAIEARTLAAQVRDVLRRDVLENRLQPGARLREAELAERFGMSRAPIREALRQLAAEGMVAITPRRGAVVVALSTQEFLEAYQLREALEWLAVRLAVPKLSSADVRRLRQYHEQMIEASSRGDVDTFFRANSAFHGLFVERCANRRVQEWYAQMMEQLRRHRMHSVILRGGMQRSAAEHGAILEAVEAGDPEQAAQMMSEHIRVPQRTIENAAAAGRWGDPVEGAAASLEGAAAGTAQGATVSVDGTPGGGGLTAAGPTRDGG